MNYKIIVLIIFCCCFIFGCVAIPGKYVTPQKHMYKIDNSPKFASKEISIIVTSNEGWQSSGVNVEPDDVIELSATGTWRAGPIPAAHPWVGADGHAMWLNYREVPIGNLMSLIGRIGEGYPIVVGSRSVWKIKNEGILYFRANDANGVLWDNKGELNLAVKLYRNTNLHMPTAEIAHDVEVPTNVLPSAKSPLSDRNVNGQVPKGLYKLEQEITFNVLDRVVFEPVSGQVTLIGHSDESYAGPKIPYLQHLAELLEHPNPEFSLDWTPQSEAKIEEFLRSMDDPTAMGGFASGLGEWLRSDGKATALGRRMLPLIGVKPTENGAAPGYLGAEVAATGDWYLDVVGVKPGSPAERAGLQAGDSLGLVNSRQLWHPVDFVRMIRRTGAGGTVKLDISRSGYQGGPIIVNLEATMGDPWDNIDRYDVFAALLRESGMPRGAQVIEAVAGFGRITDPEYQQMLIEELIGATNQYAHREELTARYNQGEISADKWRELVSRGMVEGMEEAFNLHAGALTASFDAAVYSGSSAGQAFEATFSIMDNYLLDIGETALRTIFNRLDEVVIPASLAPDHIGIRPEVNTRYIDIEADSQLARVMFEADYLVKSLVEMPQLTDKIAAYETQFAFGGHSGSKNGNVQSITQRLWISIDGVDLSQTPDNHTLNIGEARMRFNIRDVAVGGETSLASSGGGYAEFLTSLYDDFAHEFPVLHELHETAKLASVSHWIRAQKPNFRLPMHGRTQWQDPGTLPGVVYLMWEPKGARVQIATMGGVSLITNDIVIPVDASVVDLRPSRLVVPEDGLGILAKFVHPEIQAPVPRPIGWVTRDKIDGKSVTAITITVNGSERDAPTEILLGKDIEDNALVLWKTDDLEGAEKAYREQLRQLENDPQRQAEVKLLLAQVLHEKGDDTAAIKLLKEATQIAPDHPLVQLMHAKALDEGDDRQGAIKVLRKFISTQPDNKAAVKVLAEMESAQVGGSIKSGLKDILDESVDSQGLMGRKPGSVRPEDAGLTSEVSEKGTSLEQKYQEAREIINWTPKGMQKPMLMPAEIVEHSNFQAAQKRLDFQEKGQKRWKLVEKQKKLQKKLEMVRTLEVQEEEDNKEELEKIKIRYQEDALKLEDEIKKVDADIHDYLVNFDEEEEEKQPETRPEEKPAEGDKEK